MKRYLTGVICLLMPIVSFAQSEHVLNVNGVGTIVFEPDYGLLSLEARGNASNVDQAKQATDRIAGSFVARIEALGVASEDIRSDPMTVSQASDRDGRVYTNYQRTTTVVIRDLGLFEAIEAAAIESGITNIGRIQYSHSDLKGLQDEALSAAFEDAEDQARQTAEALNLNLGRVVNVTVSARATPLISDTRSGPAFSIAPANRRTGQMQITRNVQITYRLLE